MFSLATAPENARQIWLAARGEYSRRSLSVQSDKLLAIAAVAEELAETYGGRYLAGLWEKDLAIDLLWRCARDLSVNNTLAERKPRADDYVAPSWSWASVDGAVEDFVHVWEDEGDDGGLGVKDSLGFEVVSCEVKPAVEGFAYGAVISGVLIVRGQVKTFTWHPSGDEEFRVGQESDSLLTTGPGDLKIVKADKVGEVMSDALDPELKGGVQVCCLATRQIENVRGRDDIEGLMLLPTGNGRYRRVGFFRLSGVSELSGFEVKELAIV